MDWTQSITTEMETGEQELALEGYKEEDDYSEGNNE